MEKEKLFFINAGEKFYFFESDVKYVDEKEIVLEKAYVVYITCFPITDQKGNFVIGHNISIFEFHNVELKDIQSKGSVPFKSVIYEHLRRYKEGVLNLIV